jgi:hypothetical protein
LKNRVCQILMSSLLLLDWKLPPYK